MIYAFRGWIAFVAFMDLGTAVRSYIEKRSFLSKSFNDTDFVDGRIQNRVLSILNFECFRGIYNLANFRSLLNS